MLEVEHCQLEPVVLGSRCDDGVKVVEAMRAAVVPGMLDCSARS
jgi:hypothetical protein